MDKKILIATGGTGGHIYPAMALAQRFAKESKDSKVLFVGGGLSQNRYFDRTEFDFRTVDCGAFIHKSPLSLMSSLWNISKGILQSRSIIKEFKPDLAVGFGSYYSFPPLVAALSSSIPFILHEANSIPGKVNRVLAPYALATGVHFPHTIPLLKGKTFEVGMPLRQGFEKDRVSTEEARTYFGLFERKATVLIFGGSQGAGFVNQKIPEALNLYCGALNSCTLHCVKASGFERSQKGSSCNIDPFAIVETRELSHGAKSKNSTIRSIETAVQVIHITGDSEQSQDLVNFYKNSNIEACVKPFENRMDLAWQAADFVICRAGASSIAEQLEFEIPGVLIPFPPAADDHQNLNADFLVNTVGGAEKIQEKDFEAASLSAIIRKFLENDCERLNAMKAAMRDYKDNARTKDLYTLVIESLKIEKR